MIIMMNNKMIFHYHSCLLSFHTYKKMQMINFCTIECSLKQLSDDIDYTYKDMTDRGFILSRYRIAVIKHKILSGNYNLKCILVHYVTQEYLDKYLLDTLIYNSYDIIIGKFPPVRFPYGRNLVYVIRMSDSEDTYVLMGLARMLLRISYGGLPSQYNKNFNETYHDDDYNDYDLLSNLSGEHVDRLNNMGKVDKLFMLDLDRSFRTLPKNLILDKIILYVDDESVYKLIKSFLYLDMIDDNGLQMNNLDNGIPLVGTISRVLMDIVLKEIFDREFTKRYPGKLVLPRFLDEIVIVVKENDDVLFDDEDAYTLLRDLGLKGTIRSIEQGLRRLFSV